MSELSVITLAAAKAYTDEKTSEIQPTVWIGNTTTALSEGSTTNPITIDGSPVTATSGNIAAYDGTEYIFTGSVWQKFGGKFADLTDVNVSSPTGGQIARWNGTSNKWENSNEVNTFVGLTDTNVVSPADGQYFKYDETSQKVVNGFKRTVLVGTLAANATTITFTNDAITSTATFDVYTDSDISYESMSRSSTTLAITYEAQSSAVGVKLVITEE